MLTRTFLSVLSMIILCSISTLPASAQSGGPKFGTPQYWKVEERKEFEKERKKRIRSIKAEYNRYLIAVEDIYKEALPYPKEDKKIKVEVDQFIANLRRIESEFQQKRREISRQYLDLIKIAKDIGAKRQISYRVYAGRRKSSVKVAKVIDSSHKWSNDYPGRILEGIGNHWLTDEETPWIKIEFDGTVTLNNLTIMQAYSEGDPLDSYRRAKNITLELSNRTLNATLKDNAAKDQSLKLSNPQETSFITIRINSTYKTGKEKKWGGKTVVGFERIQFE